MAHLHPQHKKEFCVSTVVYRNLMECVLVLKRELYLDKHKILIWQVQIHKTTYGPLIDTALYIILLMRANPLLGQVEGGLGPGSLDFFGPQMPLVQHLDAISQGPKKSRFPLATCTRNGFARIKSITYMAVS
jgi:hypothetical protein